MNAQPTTKTKNCRSGALIWIWTAAGAAIAAAVGAATNGMAVSVGWGTGLGALVGGILTFTKTKSE